jgi:CBS domain containing-hemolysin-like protein
MEIVNIILFALSFFALIVLGSIAPRRSVLSIFELERRQRAGSTSAAEELRRELLLDDVMTLRHVGEAVAMVFVVVTSLLAFGPLVGLIASLAIAILFGRVTQLDLIHSWANRLYERYEEGILKFIDNNPNVCRALRAVSIPRGESSLSSREELEHLVSESQGILTPYEKKLILNGLHFTERKVEQIMTPRGVVETIPNDELLGPLTLDELHRTGHSRFPVIDGDIDHIVGILHVRELLTLGSRQSHTARQAMEEKVYYIHQDQTLQHALAAFIKTRHHLFIVVNEYRETAGIVTLEDCIEALLGRKIVDEFDLHDDLRVVAARNAKHNNHPPKATDV